MWRVEADAQEAGSVELPQVGLADRMVAAVCVSCVGDGRMLDGVEVSLSEREPHQPGGLFEVG